MKILILLFLFFLCISYSLYSSTISGVIKDSTSGEYVISATVVLYSDSVATEPVRGTYTNKYGFFSFPDLEQGNYIIKASYVGKLPFTQKIVISDEDRFVNIALTERDVLKEGVTVTADRDRASVSTISSADIDPNFINKLPSLGGEKDVFRVLQLLPGVHSGSEISSGLYVRGGTPDQNLTLLDGVIVYNPSHLGGFLSSFNSDALKSINLIKGAFPAEFGSRLSSVLDMTMKEGTKEDISGTASLSLISTKFTLEGPINDDITFMISGRRMYLDLLVNLFADEEANRHTPDYYFYDLNLKTNLKISEKDHIFVSGFFAKDILDTQGDDSDDYVDIGWSNTTGSVRWMHIAGANLFTNFSFIYTDYSFRTRLVDVKDKFEFRSETGIRDFTLKAEAEYFPDKDHRIKSGLEFTDHDFKINTIETLFENIESEFGEGRKLNSLDISYYVQDEWSITNRLNTNIGMRFNLFTSGGYFAAEPRISAKYALSDISYLKGAFGMTSQPMHLIYRSEINLPTDSWLPVSDKIEPGKAWQVVLGYETELWDDYFFSVEGYYKDMSNIYEYADTVSYFSPESIEDQLTQGTSDSWGIELFLEKRVGNLKGWVGYTLSKTMRYFDGLNNGKPFPPRHDRTHDAKIVMTYDLGKGWEVGAVWVYGTGQAYTVPTAKYFPIGLNDVYDYSSNYLYTERNGYRMPAYHRMDLNIMRNFSWFGLPWEFSLNIYNVYNRMNPFAIYIDYDYETDKDVLKQITLFPLIPTFGLSVKF